MHCSECGIVQVDNAKYCHSCGAELVTYEQDESVEFHYAGFWIRTVACVVDAVITNFLIRALSSWLWPSAVHVQAVYLNALPFVLYFWLFIVSPLQATPGMLLVRLRVIDEDGGRVPVSRGLIRSVIFALTAVITACIGFIVVAFTKKKQGAHDLVARTLVIHK